MRLHPHLAFDGHCEEAFNFYAESLHGKISFLLRFGDSPMAQQTPAGWHDKVIHATLMWGDQVLSGADAWGDRYRAPQGFSVTLDVEDPAEADRLFAALARNGTVTMPIQETFWAHRFGALTDQFQVPWMINCGKQR